MGLACARRSGAGGGGDGGDAGGAPAAASAGAAAAVPAVAAAAAAAAGHEKQQVQHPVRVPGTWHGLASTRSVTAGWSQHLAQQRGGVTSSALPVQAQAQGCCAAAAAAAAVAGAGGPVLACYSSCWFDCV